MEKLTKNMGKPLKNVMQLYFSNTWLTWNETEIVFKKGEYIFNNLKQHCLMKLLSFSTRWSFEIYSSQELRSLFLLSQLFKPHTYILKKQTIH